MIKYYIILSLFIHPIKIQHFAVFKKNIVKVFRESKTSQRKKSKRKSVLQTCSFSLRLKPFSYILLQYLNVMTCIQSRHLTQNFHKKRIFEGSQFLKAFINGVLVLMIDSLTFPPTTFIVFIRQGMFLS